MICHDDATRREEIRKRPDLNGFDFAEFLSDQPLKLRVYFLGKAPQLTKDDLEIVRGGAQVESPGIDKISIQPGGDPKLDDYMEVSLTGTHDQSPYELRIRPRAPGIPDERGFVEPYDRCVFSFQGNGPVELDCGTPPVCPPIVHPTPEIDYLAKDYASFRRLIFDRLSLLAPQWTERHVPDLGVTLVEILAYVADHLSYFQDAVATEAYLGTARKRISVRRHARLVDYRLHEGSNTRAFVTITTEQERDQVDADDLFFVTRFPGAPPEGTMVQWHDLVSIAPPGTYEVFEPVTHAASIPLRRAHNEIRIYAWLERECCLPAGTTRATLCDAWLPRDPDERPVPTLTNWMAAGVSTERRRALDLRKGDFLIFEEMKSPTTGRPEDADTSHRHVVRLTKVTPRTDPARLVESDDEQLAMPIVEVEWDASDALPFALCLSALGGAPECAYINDVSVARGNVVLVDHGARHDQCLGRVPLVPEEQCCENAGVPSPVVHRPGRFRPALERAPLAFGDDPPGRDVPAARLLAAHPREAKPRLRVTSKRTPPPIAGLDGCPGTPFTDGETWQCREDLLNSDPDARDVVVEVDEDGIGHLRFGDGDCGAMPDPDVEVHARYRVGGGPAGNVGAETIRLLGRYGKMVDGECRRARNPLPAAGGVAPEPMEEAKILAPQAFRQQLERAITADDYATLATYDPDHPSERNPDVQRAAATLTRNEKRWAVEVVIDPFQHVTNTADLCKRITDFLKTCRRIGHDVNDVTLARYVPLEVELKVTVHPSYLKAHVCAALLEVFSNRVLPDGRLGFFHPDRLSFGQGIYVSRLMAEAQRVDGVDAVQVTGLRRRDEIPPDKALEDGVLPIHELEVARLDNDPNFPDHGRLTITPEGGR